MITLVRIFTEKEHEVELAEFRSDDEYVNYAYIEYELLLDDDYRGHYGAFFNVAMQLQKGPEDVQDAFMKWRKEVGGI